MPSAVARGRSPLLVVGVLVALGLGLAVVLSRLPSTAAPESTAEPSAVPTPVPAVSVAAEPPRAKEAVPEQRAAHRIATLEARVAELEADLQGAIARADRAELEAAVQRQEAARWRQGLDRAVAELNRIGGSYTPPALPPRAAAPAQSDVLLVGTPSVYVEGERLVASGRVKNYGDALLTVSIAAKLHRDHREVERQVIRVTLDPGAAAQYRVEWRTLPSRFGLTTASATIESVQ